MIPLGSASWRTARLALASPTTSSYEDMCTLGVCLPDCPGGLGGSGCVLGLLGASWDRFAKQNEQGRTEVCALWVFFVRRVPFQ